MLRYSCLIIGVLAVLLLLVSLITCRLSGFPIAEGAETTPIAPIDRFGESWNASVRLGFLSVAQAAGP